MSTQLPLLAPGSGGLETRLHHRREDPVTSKTAARKMVESGKLTGQQREALAIIKKFKPGTPWELSDGTYEQYHMLARRLPELERLGLVRVQRDEAGLVVKRRGSRCWECTVE